MTTVTAGLQRRENKSVPELVAAKLKSPGPYWGRSTCHIHPEELSVKGSSDRYVSMGGEHGQPMKGGRLAACLQFFL